MGKFSVSILLQKRIERSSRFLALVWVETLGFMPIIIIAHRSAEVLSGLSNFRQQVIVISFLWCDELDIDIPCTEVLKAGSRESLVQETEKKLWCLTAEPSVVWAFVWRRIRA